MRLKYKLLLLALVPLCFLLFFSIRTTLDKTRQAQQMAALERLVGVSADIGALVHELLQVVEPRLRRPGELVHDDRLGEVGVLLDVVGVEGRRFGARLRRRGAPGAPLLLVAEIVVVAEPELEPVPIRLRAEMKVCGPLGA